jgi:hypothetical protein
MYHEPFSTEDKKRIAGFGPGDMVVFVEQPDEHQIKWGGNDDPGKVLTVGGTYKVRDVEIHSYHCKVFLEGIEGKFNAVSFRSVQ